MTSEVRYVWKRLWTEIKKDWLFFGGCGFFVVIVFILRGWLKVKGIAQGDNWGVQLSSDFMSFNAFILIIFFLAFFTSIDLILKMFGWHLPCFIALVDHVENRLVQITSSVFSFMLGFSVILLLHSAITITANRALRAVTILYFGGQLLFICAGMLLIRRIQPRYWWRVAPLVLLCALGGLFWFLLMGGT